MIRKHSRFVLPHPLTRHSVSRGKEVQGSGRQIGDTVLSCLCLICLIITQGLLMRHLVYLTPHPSPLVCSLSRARSWL